MKCSLGISNFLEEISVVFPILSAQFSYSVMSDSLQPHVLQNARLSCPSPTSILLFSCISLHWSLRKAFLSLLAILWNSAFKWVYLSLSLLLLASLLFTAISKAFSYSHFAFLHFFSVGMVLIPVSCTMSRTSIHSSSGTLSIRSSPLIYFSLPLYNHKGIFLGGCYFLSAG